jgi:hypothetical protein
MNGVWARLLGRTEHRKWTHRTSGVSEICVYRNRKLCLARTCWLLSRGIVDSNRTYSTNMALVFNVSPPHLACYSRVST